MFEKTGLVCVTFAKIEHLGLDKDDAEIDLVKVTMELNPLTAKKAEDLSEAMRRMLFKRADGTVTPELHSATFNLSIPEQRIKVFMAPDQSEPSFVITEANISPFKVSRGQGDNWRMRFAVKFQPASAHQLQQVVESRAKAKYCFFEDTQASLFSPSAEQRTRAVRAEAKQGIGPAASAAAH